MKNWLPLIFAGFLFACQAPKKKPTHHLEAVLSLHHAQRDHHFQKDSVAFVDQLSTEFISVNRGKITRPSRAEMLSRYHSYFSAVEFVRWDDLMEPVLRFSDDSSMAYSIVDKMVTVRYPATDGKTIEDSTHYAWATVYRREGEKWQVESVTSTNEESISGKIEE